MTMVHGPNVPQSASLQQLAGAAVLVFGNATMPAAARVAVAAKPDTPPRMRSQRVPVSNVMASEPDVSSAIQRSARLHTVPAPPDPLAPPVGPPPAPPLEEPPFAAPPPPTAPAPPDPEAPPAPPLPVGVV